MHLEPNFPAAIRGFWVRNTQLAQQAGTTLGPQQFAEMFVDANLVPRDS
jgi:hypothetical protein